MTHTSGNSLLLRLFQSHHFTSNFCIAYLHRYSEDVGIQHTLCALILSKFPQLALMSLWLYQCYVLESAGQPRGAEFQARKRMYNSVQLLVFGDGRSLSDKKRMKPADNIAPALLLAGLILASFASPSICVNMGQVALAEAKAQTPAAYLESNDSGTESSNSNTRPSLSELLDQPKLNNAIDQAQLLKSNYFRQETEFLLALQDISTRLAIVPRPARLSALRAELTLLNQDLPANINIPGLSNTRDAHYSVVRICPKEASVLNSAERVPYIIMVEVLRGKLSFDPKRKRNKILLNKIRNGKESRRKFDLKATDIDYRKAKQNSKGSELSFMDASFDDEIDLGDISLGSIDDYASSSDDDDAFNDNLTNMKSIKYSKSIQSREFSRDFKSDPFTNEIRIPQRRSDTSLPDTFSEHKKIQRSEEFDMTCLATHMRAAATMLAQLDSGAIKRPKGDVAAIKARIITEMQNLEEERLSKVNSSYENHEKFDIDESTDGEKPINLYEIDRKRDHEDPSAAIFEENWDEKKERIRISSPYGHLPEWNLLSVIVKTGGDLRQEAFACQLIQVFKRIWESAQVNVWIRHLRILVTGESSGLVETIANAISIHSIKKTLTKKLIEYDPTRIASIGDYFVQRFGSKDSMYYYQAQTNFIQSLAGYSVICYLLQLKDRHNGNILLDSEGHIVHIDFGFILSNTPGNVGFESAPFKLTWEYLEIIGDRFDEFKNLFKEAFKAARKKADEFVLLVTVMEDSSRLPCFLAGQQTHVQLQQRFNLQLSETELDQFLDLLITRSNCSVWTRLYDQYQMLSQGIY